MDNSSIVLPSIIAILIIVLVFRGTLTPKSAGLWSLLLGSVSIYFWVDIVNLWRLMNFVVISPFLVSD
jgi:hypothetical protein